MNSAQNARNVGNSDASRCSLDGNPVTPHAPANPPGIHKSGRASTVPRGPAPTREGIHPRGAAPGAPPRVEQQKWRLGVSPRGAEKW